MFMLHTHRKTFKDKIKQTKEIITMALNEHNCYVSFSGGKDSTVMLHLALSIDSNVPVWHWDYGDYLIPRSIYNEILTNLEILGVNNLVVDKRKGDDARVNYSYGYEQFFKTIKGNKCLYGWDMGLVGVRKSESTTRKNKYTDFFMGGDCYPLLEWDYMDIWGYIVKYDLPYPNVYDLYAPFLGYDKARFVTFFDGEFSTLQSTVDGIILPEFRYL